MRDTQLRFWLYIFRTRVIFRVFRCRSHSAIFRESTASQHIYKAYSPVLESSPVRWFPLEGAGIKRHLDGRCRPQCPGIGVRNPTKSNQTFNYRLAAKLRLRVWVLSVHPCPFALTRWSSTPKYRTRLGCLSPSNIFSSSAVSLMVLWSLGWNRI